MTATERLRAMLDERGVEYEVDDAKTVRVTRWGAYGDWVSFIEYDNGDTKFCIDARRLTPEQAIAATLGDADLAAENAGLRELAADMYEMAYPEYPSAFEAAFAGRLHELGVEVDDGTE